MNVSNLKRRRKFIELKPKAINLRKEGKTYGEIREIYDIPKSTLSNWLSKLKMNSKTKKLIQKKGYERWRKTVERNAKQAKEKAEKVRLKIKSEAEKEIKKVNNNELKLIGTVLYFAEGDKKSRNQIRFSNTDERLIKIMMKFFREVCNVSDEKIKARIHLYPNINYEKAKKHWAKITGLPKKNFYPPQIQISQASKGKRSKNTLPYGTLHLSITELAGKMRGWFEGLIKQI